MEQELQVILDHHPIPPNVYGEIVLCFDCNKPINSLNDIIGIPAQDVKRLQDTRINPITKRHNPGYWVYRTKVFSCPDYDCEPLFMLLNDLLTMHMEGLKKAMHQYAPCDVFIRIYADIQQQGEYPAIRLSSALLSTIVSLDACIDVIIADDFDCGCI